MLGTQTPSAQKNFYATVDDSRPLHLCAYQDLSVAWETFEDISQPQAQLLAPHRPVEKIW